MAKFITVTHKEHGHTLRVNINQIMVYGPYPESPENCIVENSNGAMLLKESTERVDELIAEAQAI